MKTVTDLFDIVLLLVILGIMLPALFGYINPLVSPESYGFSAADDKTMKLAEGDVLLSGSDDCLSAAEIVLMTRYSAEDKLNTFVLPNGYIIKGDESYMPNTAQNTAQAQGALAPAQKYAARYDYKADVWRIE